jgi:protein phosphatase
VGRAADQLDLTDVLGKRVIETAHHGRVTIREDNAAGALEVMSRFALHPRWLPYLPPTMAPVATSARDDLLEHPAEAFADYRSAGVAEVVCEEKHMGSRAVVVLCRDQQAASTGFGAPDGETGAVYTRTGRAFFAPDVTETLLAGLREEARGAGIWASLETSWVVLDCELLPWSAKAEDLLRHQYAAVGAAARAALPAAVAALSSAALAGLDVGELLARTSARAANASAFAEAYRRYCWPVSSLDGVQLAPFQVLAAQGSTFQDRDHAWHLSVADRLVAADPELIRPTRRLVVEVGDAESVAEGIAWWTALTAEGGEGMVVKPLANLTRTAKGGLVQPGQ